MLRLCCAVLVALVLGIVSGCAPGGGGGTTCTNGIQDNGESDVDCGNELCGACGPAKKCQTASHCASKACVAGQCAAGTCSDGVRDFHDGVMESDVDCGRNCSLCTPGAACFENEDCATDVCSNHRCVVAGCNDGQKNAGESGTDCGGQSSCGPCPDLEGCSVDADCLSNACGADHLCHFWICNDGRTNGDESDQDCGGSHCDGCQDGAHCSAAGDCGGGDCQDGICVTATCLDQRKNGLETDVDCGAGCAACEVGLHCQSDADCATNDCLDGTCITPDCSNLLRDGTESDVDCGGRVCEGCRADALCNVNDDCAGRYCVNSGGIKRCVQPTCNDRHLNGTESDLDCGRDCAFKCANTLHCNGDPDCASGWCHEGVCLLPICTDHFQNANETDVDCGGYNCSREGHACSNGQHCLEQRDCRSQACDPVNHACAAASCSNGFQDTTETSVDCGGVGCGGCEVGAHCNLNSDCTLASCEGGTCAPPSCSNLRQDGDEGGVDCGGSCATKCALGGRCQVNGDCGTGECEFVAATNPSDPDAFRCVAATCGNTTNHGPRQDSVETDVNCGGVCSTKCSLDKGCLIDGDCTTGLVCARSRCVASTCRNGEKDSNESGVDCGGACAPCAPGDNADCLISQDCTTRFCFDGVCASQELFIEATQPDDMAGIHFDQPLYVTFNQPIAPASLIGCIGHDVPAGCNVVLRVTDGHTFLPVWVVPPLPTPALARTIQLSHTGLPVLNQNNHDLELVILSGDHGPRGLLGERMDSGDFVVGFFAWLQ